MVTNSTIKKVMIELVQVQAEMGITISSLTTGKTVSEQIGENTQKMIDQLNYFQT